MRKRCRNRGIMDRGKIVERSRGGTMQPTKRLRERIRPSRRERRRKSCKEMGQDLRTVLGGDRESGWYQVVEGKREVWLSGVLRMAQQEGEHGKKGKAGPDVEWGTMSRRN